MCAHIYAASKKEISISAKAQLHTKKRLSAIARMKRNWDLECDRILILLWNRSYDRTLDKFSSR
ncbi:hypothetical protein ACE1CD_16185 [Aerosakkonema sp. BLCC-F183]|uniref:hypothetical protein n=1 Tax=Aerosakkonema sp. BLCC-F183 TaxID=3342834 RepID=UPI0035B7B5A1